jgi:TolA-binding protein
MAFYPRWLLIFCALVLGGGQVMAASSREDRTYAAAVASFQTEMWSRAEGAFAQFIQRYPQSTNAPMAVLLQAQAQYNQGKLPEAINLLTARKAQAGELTDQYVLWVGEAQFAGKNFPAAAATFTSLADDFPDSPLRLRAAVEAAAAYAQMRQWGTLSTLLEATNGVFARKAELDGANELVSRGRLLLAQARYAGQDYAGASALLQMLNPQTLKPELDWQRAYLLCETKTAAGELDAALAAAASLSQIAQLEKSDRHRAEGAVLRGGILEKLGRTGDAMAAYQENLAPGTPEEKQREAILKFTELAAGLKQFTNAEQALDSYLKQFPGSAQADIALLTGGELRLKDYVLSSGTNQLPAAQVQFDTLLARFPGSPLAGKAYLDRGWCLWLAGKTNDSLPDFETAAQKQLSPQDRAVAKFKAGDVLFAQTNLAAAREHYRAVFSEIQAAGLPDRPSAQRDLAGRALYQILRTSIGLDDTNAAAGAFAKIFGMFSSGELGQGSALLYGESLVDPREARSLFERIAPDFSGSPLEPQLRLSIARTYEQEPDWAAAITNYTAWVHDFPTNALRPQVDYALAQATYQAGDEAGALTRYTQFVAQNPVNPLAPQAQWWVAEHFFRAGEYPGAETNYEAVFQSTNAVWKNSTLVYPAQLMAGRAAVGRAGYKDAVDNYFSKLIADTNCPEDLQVKARFACGAALMSMNSSDANTNLVLATNLFSQIVQLLNPTNEMAARAWGEIGDCAQQLGDYVTATNAYAQVYGANSTADIPARSQAQVGCGMVLEKMAAQAGDPDLAGLLNNLALDNYLAVFDGTNLREGETPAAFWVGKAGMQAARLVGLLNTVEAQRNFYKKLQAKLPPLAEAIQKKIDALPAEKN